MGELRLPHSPLSDGVITLRAFTREGVLRSYVVARGTRHDCVMYSLLPDDPSPGGGAP